MALKATSSPIAISTNFVQGAASTFNVQVVDLQLNPLDLEVFVVTAVKIDFNNLPTVVGIPDSLVQGEFRASVCKSRPTAMQGIGDNNCIAAADVTQSTAFDAASNPIALAYHENSPMDTPPSQLEYLDIIATDSFFIALDGTNTPNAATGAVRLFGYRARADSATYAALVQSEMLSA